jgi:hypothetical protein
VKLSQAFENSFNALQLAEQDGLVFGGLFRDRLIPRELDEPRDAACGFLGGGKVIPSLRGQRRRTAFAAQPGRTPCKVVPQGAIAPQLGALRPVSTPSAAERAAS